MKKLHHIDLLVGEIDKARQFFEEVLGFEISSNPTHKRAKSFEALVPSEAVVRFEIHELNDEYRASHQKEMQYGKPNVDHMGFSVRDVESTCDALVKAGVELKSTPHTNAVGRKIARATDSDGNGWLQLVETAED